MPWGWGPEDPEEHALPYKVHQHTPILTSLQHAPRAKVREIEQIAGLLQQECDESLAWLKCACIPQEGWFLFHRPWWTWKGDAVLSELQFKWEESCSTKYRRRIFWVIFSRWRKKDQAKEPSVGCRLCHWVPSGCMSESSLSCHLIFQCFGV